MSVKEAIVLLVRERALLIDDGSITANTHLISENGSFISKNTAGDLFLEYSKDLRDGNREESIIGPISITNDS